MIETKTNYVPEKYFMSLFCHWMEESVAPVCCFEQMSVWSVHENLQWWQLQHPNLMKLGFIKSFNFI